jgi:TonB family protein
MKAIWILLFVCLVSSVHAQTADSVSRDTTPEDQRVFFAVDQQAEFTGGIDGMTKFLNENIVYPSKARKKKIQGKVFVKFIVEKDGTLSSIEVLKGVHSLLDEEAFRVVSVSPPWIPGKQSGKVVRSQFVLPINFVLY